MTGAVESVGELLRGWRQHRRVSQLDLAVDAEISQRHLSFLETGRSSPSREMVLRLAERLAVPLRERNRLLLAAGFAPVFPERPLGDPAMSAARQAMEMVLKGHEPNPALAVDRHWTLVAMNNAMTPFLTRIDPVLLEPPVNVLRLSLHPNGAAPRIVNLPEWRTHLFERLRQQIEMTADPVLVALLAELRTYPATGAASEAASRTGTGQFTGGAAAVHAPAVHAPNDAGPVVVPLQFASDAGILSFISTTMVFGTPVDVTLSELALESFFPADAATAEHLRQLHAGA